MGSPCHKSIFLLWSRGPNLQGFDFACCAAHNSKDPFVTRNPVMDNGLFAPITPHLDGVGLGAARKHAGAVKLAAGCGYPELGAWAERRKSLAVPAVAGPVDLV